MAEQQKDISIVVPIYNEVASVEPLYNSICKTVEALNRTFEIIFVDDGSSDESKKKILQIQESSSTLILVELAKNYGQTAALAAGIDAASGKIIITMDGDLQHDPEEIPRFIEKLEEGYDVVSGWREVRTDSFWLRRIPSLSANFLMRYFSKMKVKDFGSTYKAYRAEMLKKVELFGELHRFIPVLLHRMGAKIAEIPIAVHPREKGKSNYGLKRTFGVFEDIIFLSFYSNHLTNPIRVFGKFFLFFFAIGFIIAALLMVAWLVGLISAVIEHAALLLFSVFMMIVGIQFLVLGILSELLTRIYMHTSNSKIYSIRALYKPNK